LIIPCRLPAWAYSTLPVPVILKRFLALDLVFILGILLSLDGQAVPGYYGRPQAAVRLVMSEKEPPRQP
jgi:hypothetical protein